tara:strand:+ start:239 stop:610 length:372 start_codon:yes stop_codon:yes gene_type:complete
MTCTQLPTTAVSSAAFVPATIVVFNTFKTVVGIEILRIKNTERLGSIILTGVVVLGFADTCITFIAIIAAGAIAVIVARLQALVKRVAQGIDIANKAVFALAIFLTKGTIFAIEAFDTHPTID